MERLTTCQALLFPEEEDFGMVLVEAMASGAPVIAFARGEVLETVIDGKLGILYHGDKVEDLISAIWRFEACKQMSPTDLVARVAKFAPEVFKHAFSIFVEDQLRLHALGSNSK